MLNSRAAPIGAQCVGTCRMKSPSVVLNSMSNSSGGACIIGAASGEHSGPSHSRAAASSLPVPPPAGAGAAPLLAAVRPSTEADSAASSWRTTCSVCWMSCSPLLGLAGAGGAGGGLCSGAAGGGRLCSAATRACRSES
eukprot:SAG22_NODE_343_length_11944_cov_15.500042_5_plen_139_part_00